MGAQTQIGHLNGVEWLGDHTCGCGRRSRFASLEHGAQFRPFLVCDEPLGLDDGAVESAA